jgi:hypothetical protein
VRRDPRQVGKGGAPLPLRATAIVLAVWTTGLVVLAFVVVPALFATCGLATLPSGGPAP